MGYLHKGTKMISYQVTCAILHKQQFVFNVQSRLDFHMHTLCLYKLITTQIAVNHPLLNFNCKRAETKIEIHVWFSHIVVIKVIIPPSWLSLTAYRFYEKNPKLRNHFHGIKKAGNEHA